MSRVIVPLAPGALCAMGLLLTDLRADFALSRQLPLAEDIVPTIEAGFADLWDQATAWFDAEQISPENRVTSRTADLRYKGQNYELSVPVPGGPITPDTIAALKTGFDQAHLQRFGFVADGEPVQLVTLRLEATGIVKKTEIKKHPVDGPDASPAKIGSREVWLPETDGFATCPVYARERLRAGNIVQGPAIVEQMDTTTVILPGMHATVDPYLNLVMETAA